MKNLPENSVALFTVYFRTKNNKFLNYYEAIEKITKNSNVPVYGLWDFTLGHGIVGGYLTSGYFQGEKAAQIAQEILDGRDVKSIPILLKSPNKYMFDYQQIKKHNVNESQIPYKSLFINNPSGLISLIMFRTLSDSLNIVKIIIFVLGKCCLASLARSSPEL